jgi:hypothetical protein
LHAHSDLLTLLSFADSQMQTLAKFGVDTKVISDLNTDLLRQYVSVSQQLMKTWMGRIHEADVKADAEVRSLSVSLCLFASVCLSVCLSPSLVSRF